MMNNGWRDRIKKEKARKLKDIKREHEEKNRAQNHRHQHNNYNHQRNGGGGNGRNNRSSYDNNSFNGYGGRSGSQFKRGSPSSFQRSDSSKVVLKSQKSKPKVVEHDEVDPMDRIMKLIRQCLVSKKSQDLIAFLQKEGNAATYNGHWGEIINSVFVNRKESEVEQFMAFMVEMVEGQCIVMGNDCKFVNRKESEVEQF